MSYEEDTDTTKINKWVCSPLFSAGFEADFKSSGNTSSDSAIALDNQFIML